VIPDNGCATCRSCWRLLLPARAALAASALFPGRPLRHRGRSDRGRSVGSGSLAILVVHRMQLLLQPDVEGTLSRPLRPRPGRIAGRTSFVVTGHHVPARERGPFLGIAPEPLISPPGTIHDYTTPSRPFGKRALRTRLPARRRARPSDRPRGFVAGVVSASTIGGRASPFKQQTLQCVACARDAALHRSHRGRPVWAAMTIVGAGLRGRPATAPRAGFGTSLAKGRHELAA